MCRASTRHYTCGHSQAVGHIARCSEHGQVLRMLNAQGLPGPGRTALWCLGDGMDYFRQRQDLNVCPDCAAGQRVPGATHHRVSRTDDDAARPSRGRRPSTGHGAAYGGGTDFGRRHADYEPFTNNYPALRAPEDRLSALNRGFEPLHRPSASSSQQNRSGSRGWLGRLFRSSSSAAASGGSARRRGSSRGGPSRLSREW